MNLASVKGPGERCSDFFLGGGKTFQSRMVTVEKYIPVITCKEKGKSDSSCARVWKNIPGSSQYTVWFLPFVCPVRLPFPDYCLGPGISASLRRPSAFFQLCEGATPWERTCVSHVLLRKQNECHWILFWNNGDFFDWCVDVKCWLLSWYYQWASLKCNNVPFFRLISSDAHIVLSYYPHKHMARLKKRLQFSI